MTTTERAETVIEHLEAALVAGQPMGIALDGDGTLWSGDVGEDTFAYVVDEVGLKREVKSTLDAFATSHQVTPDGSPDTTARRLLEAFREGRISDLPACEFMTWAYAGFSPDELRAMTRAALVRASLLSRKQTLLEPIVAWARGHGLHLVLVSASPQIVVEEAAAALWGFAPTEVIGARARIADNRILAEMDAPVPFARRKRELAEAHFGETTWLASFGDNFFDLDLLRAPKVGVAVRPKATLLSRITESDGILILDDRDAETISGG